MRLKLLTFFLIFISMTSAFSVSAEKQEKLNVFRDYILEMKENWKVPGMAVGIVDSDEVIFMETFGTLSNKGITDVNEHTTFQIGSTSKAFTATLMAILAETGEISWNDRVRDHYPTFQMADPWVSDNMRIHDLMAQHSGMYPYVGDMAVIFGFDEDYILDKLKYMQPLYQFRKDFTYVNTLFLVSEKILESKYQSSFESILHEKIFGPLSMKDTTISYEKHLQNKNKTTTHVYA
ncbi:MAG: class A beta-lactamase-related serine hydrolase, partial [Candidatus Moranbacteria bacterium]|nr:class A beta-lactamase-related serine hydrolase [Candidatus Moranbacteria bacterium]